MRGRLYAPKPAGALLLSLLAGLALLSAAALRWWAIEASDFARACEFSGHTLGCSARRIALTFTHHDLFGGSALALASLHLARPSLMLAGLALIAACCGLLLYNVSLSAVALTLLVLSLARAAPEPE